MKTPPEEIVLDWRRQLTFSTPGKTSSGELVIERIAFLPDRQSWGCYWRIDYVRPDAIQPIYGDDPLHALTNSLGVIAALLRESGVPDLQISWQSPDDNCGFPVEWDLTRRCSEPRDSV
jgi:hypothetical protein